MMGLFFKIDSYIFWTDISSCKGVRSIYSSFFSWLRDRDRIRKNPMVLVEDIKVPIRVREPFTDAEREKLLRECRTLRDKAMMEFMYSTAVRVARRIILLEQK